MEIVFEVHAVIITNGVEINYLFLSSFDTYEKAERFITCEQDIYSECVIQKIYRIK